MPSLKKMLQTTGKAMPHTGELIRAQMEKNHVTASELARQMGVPPTTVPNYLRQPTCHAALLWKIGQVLGHNFFAAIAAEFPVLAAATAQEAQLRQEVAALQAQLADAQKEIALYEKVLGKLKLP